MRVELRLDLGVIYGLPPREITWNNQLILSPRLGEAAGVDPNWASSVSNDATSCFPLLSALPASYGFPCF